MKKSSPSGSFFQKHWGKLFYALLFVAVYPISIFLSFTAGKAVGEYKFDSLVEGDVREIYTERNPESVLPDDIDFDPFWKTWALLNQKFVHSSATSTKHLDTQDQVWGAIQGLAASYDDPYTVFLPPTDNDIFREDIKGEFSGIGIEIGIHEQLLTVISPLKGTPADKAGLKAKDKIIEIDGFDAINMTTLDAVTLIRGEKGTPVVLTILREGLAAPKEVTIVRDTIKIPTLKVDVSGDVTIIELVSSFNQESPDLFARELEKFVQSGGDKLIIDLRGNPGGYLTAAVDMASWFLSKGKVIVTEDSGENKNRATRAHVSFGYNTVPDDTKIVVLINGGSASASEILAGSLRDYGEVLLVGQNSFGKGSVQELVEITPDTSLKVTIAKWLLPSGDHISEDGIVPDVYVTIPEDLDVGEDPILDKGLEVIRRSDFEKLFDTIPEDLLTSDI